MKPVHLVRSLLQAARSDGLGSAYALLHERIAVNWIERPLGIATESHIPSVGMGRNGVCLGYVPTSYRNLRAAIALVRLRSSDVLLDFGCGLGRVVIDVARRYRIKRVIGIDLSADYVEIAKSNIEAAQKRLLSRIDVTQADAADFPIADDVTIAFFFNPFHGHVLENVLTNLRRSLERNPREMRIICVIPPEGGAPFREQITRVEWLQLVRFCRLLGDWKCLLFQASAGGSARQA